jgi:hypothetical protein
MVLVGWCGRLTNIKTMETKEHFYARKRDKGSCGDI